MYIFQISANNYLNMNERNESIFLPSQHHQLQYNVRQQSAGFLFSRQVGEQATETKHNKNEWHLECLFD